VTTRFVDEVIGISVTGIFLALILGNATTGSDRSTRVREFLLTRPIRRSRFLMVKLGMAFGTLNLALGLMLLIVGLDLPAHFYGLVAETTLGDRLWKVDAPVFYPAAIAFANLVLALVLYTRLFARSPSIGFVLGLILSIAAGMTVARLIAAWPHLLVTISLGICVVSLAGTIVTLSHMRGRFMRLEVTGGGS
jgi:ABC-type transport system involved in multi-copper enzyme maturation permease subunit